MKRSQFALLIGVSKQQVSKYETAGVVVVVDGEVDVEISLGLLEGRLDETKRQHALQMVGLLGQANTVRQPTAPLGGGGASKSAKAQRDEIERDLKLLQYGREVGELLLASEVEEHARVAVTEMREAFHNTKRELADQVCAQFGIPAEKAAALARVIGVGFERGLGRFSEAMAALAAPGDQPPGDAPAQDSASRA